MGTGLEQTWRPRIACHPSVLGRRRSRNPRRARWALRSPWEGPIYTRGQSSQQDSFIQTTAFPRLPEHESSGLPIPSHFLLLWERKPPSHGPMMHCPAVCRIPRIPHKGTIKNTGVNKSPFHQDTLIQTTCDPPVTPVHSLYCHDGIQLYPSPPQPLLGSSHQYLLHGPVPSSPTWFPGSCLHPVCSRDSGQMAPVSS